MREPIGNILPPAPPPPGIFHGHAHAEAFCLMLYRSDDGAYEEWVWNSRDGVTPFVISLPDQKLAVPGVAMSHVDFFRDTYAPDFKPLPGMRIFVDWSREAATTHWRERIEAEWDTRMRGRYPSKAVALERLMTGWRPGQPSLVTVGPEGWGHAPSA